MVDNIKVNIPMAAVSPAKSVTPVDQRENDNRNYFFKNSFKKRQKKKKKKDRMHVKISARAALVGKTAPIRHCLTKKKAKEFMQKRTIDIRV